MNTNDESDEREFLHDIASPVGAALFCVASVLEDMQARTDANPDEIEQLKITCNALEKVKDLLHNRRDILIKRGLPSART